MALSMGDCEKVNYRIGSNCEMEIISPQYNTVILPSWDTQIYE